MLWFMLLLCCPAAGTQAAINVKSGSQEKFGDVSVPYPFGIDDSSRAVNKYFFLNCSRGEFPPKLMFGNIVVRNISIYLLLKLAIYLTARRCYDGSGNPSSNNRNPSFRLGSGPFRFSDTRNKLMALAAIPMPIWITVLGVFGVAVFLYAEMNLPR